MPVPLAFETGGGGMMIAAVPRTKPRAAKVTQRPRSPRRLERDRLLRLGRRGRARATSSSTTAASSASTSLSGRSPVAERKALRQLARRAPGPPTQGLVHLVQRRIGPGDFTYLAIRRPRPTTRADARSAPSDRRSREPELEEAA